MPEISLTLLVLKTPQVDRLRMFYATLGIELNEEQHEKGPIHYAGRIGELVLEVYPSSASVDSSTRLGFAVENLAETLAALHAIGAPHVTQARQTSWGHRAVVRDPDGRAVELYQR